MEIRDATPEDADAACDVLRKSISQLCVADHGNDPAILNRWLSNKKPEIVPYGQNSRETRFLSPSRAMPFSPWGLSRM